MKMTGNTILITGGASGIGLGLAQAFQKLGNEVIVAGRRQDMLDEATAANPGMRSVRLDIADTAGVSAFAETLTRDFPKLNVLINNAGIMKPEDLAAAPEYVGTAEDIITTNLLGPIRLTAALLPHLRARESSAVMMVSSGLAFVPLAATPTYSATKAAIHSYAMSMRYQLKGTATQVIELIPPYVQTHLMGEQQANDPRAMPLEAFLSEVMGILSGDPDVEEVVVGQCQPLRFAAENGKIGEIFAGLNGQHF